MQNRRWMEGGRKSVKEEEVAADVKRLEGVQCLERNYDSLFHMQNIQDLLMVIK